MTICLFFTHGMSLKKWDDTGLLHREVKLYIKLVQLGYKVIFFTYGDESDLLYQKILPGIKIIPAWKGWKKIPSEKISFFCSWFLPWKFRKEFSGIDCIKTNQMWGAWVPLIFRFFTKTPLFVRCGYEAYKNLLKESGSQITRVLLYWVSRWAYASGDKVALSCKSDLEFAVNTFGLDTNKAFVHPNCVDTQLFCPQTPDIYYSDRLLYVGRLDTQKNLDSLIKAVRFSNVGLDIIGSGNLKDALILLANQTGADVNFYDIVPNSELSRIFARYPVFILPSKYENSPKALLEAMSCGKAVIGSYVDGIKEVIIDGENGLLSGTSMDSLAKNINKLIKNEALLKKLGNSARRYILDNYALEEYVQREIKVYEEIKNRKKVCKRC